MLNLHHNIIVMKNAFLFLLLFANSVSAQKLKKADKIIIDSLQSEIGFLASDRLEGRRTGSSGEKLAYEYLSGKFKNIGLIPKGDGNTYTQIFEMDEGKQILPVTNLLINDSALTV
jgi:aminopeptidase YwaD